MKIQIGVSSRNTDRVVIVLDERVFEVEAHEAESIGNALAAAAKLARFEEVYACEIKPFAGLVVGLDGG